VIPTTATTQTTVRTRTPGRSVSPNSLVKLDQPAEPMSPPSEPKCFREVWNIETTGQITTNRISPVAGAIQGSGSSARASRRNGLTCLPDATLVASSGPGAAPGAPA